MKPRLSVLALVAACSGAPPTPTRPIGPDAALDAPPTELAAMVYKQDFAATLSLLDARLAAASVPGTTGVIEPDALAALAKHWDKLVASQPTTTAAYFRLAHALGDAPPEPLAGLMTKLAQRAADGEIDLARKAKGVGGTWLHATLAAKIAGGKSPRVAAAALLAATRADLDFVPVPAVCSWVNGPARQTGRHVEVVSVALSCSSDPERKWSTREDHKTIKHRAFAARIAGRVTVRWEGGDIAVPVEIETAVEEVEPFSPANALSARPETVRKLHGALLVALANHWAGETLAAGLAAIAAKDTATAEDQLVLHARFADAPSKELAAMMVRYGVTFDALE